MAPTAESRLVEARTRLAALSAGPWRDLRAAVAEAETFLADTADPEVTPPQRGHYRWP